MPYVEIFISDSRINLLNEIKRHKLLLRLNNEFDRDGGTSCYLVEALLETCNNAFFKDRILIVEDDFSKDFWL